MKKIKVESDLVFSPCVQLRELIHQMKVRSGLKDVYQNNRHVISPQTMRNFLRMAQVHLCDPELSTNTRDLDNNDEVDDIEVLGIEKLFSIVQEEARKNKDSRFLWGSMDLINSVSDSI